jgi:hypothetical protein
MVSTSCRTYAKHVEHWLGWQDVAHKHSVPWIFSWFGVEGRTHTAWGSLNLPTRWMWYMRSPPLIYSITKYSRSCRQSKRILVAQATAGFQTQTHKIEEKLHLCKKAFFCHVFLSHAVFPCFLVLFLSCCPFPTYVFRVCVICFTKGPFLSTGSIWS